METLSVSNLMNPKVKTVNEDKNIMSACRIMHVNGIGCCNSCYYERRRRTCGDDY